MKIKWMIILLALGAVIQFAPAWGHAPCRNETRLLTDQTPVTVLVCSPLIALGLR